MEHFFCNSDFRSLIVRHLASFSREPHNISGLMHAAVAVTIVDSSKASGVPGIRHRPNAPHRVAIILTMRTPKLNNHSGQWALPGGRIEKGETVEQAALRELHEEVGLELPEESVLGRLDDFTTRSGFVMTPVVVWGGRDLELVANPGEVASIHCIPLDEFMRNDSPVLKEIPESDKPVLMLPVGNSYIAAPTAAIVHQFCEVAVLGKETRVAHYEQPVFAWK